MSIKNATLFSTGGSEPASSGDYLVKFYDFDGTLLKQEWVDSGNAATAPDTPSHDYLTFEEWNQSFSNVTHDLIVGATYETSDGKTHLFIEITSTSGLNCQLQFIKDDTTLMTIDWGDSNSDTSSSSGNVTMNHTYSSYGNYHITIDCEASYGLGRSAFYYPLSTYPQINKAYCSHYSYLTEGTFYSNYVLRYVSLPSSFTSIPDSCFKNSTYLKALIMPSGITSIYDECFQSCYSVRVISVPPSLTDFSAVNIFQGCKSLQEFVSTATITALGDSIFENCTALSKLKISGTFTSLPNDFCYGNDAFSEFIVPSTVTYIDDDAFATISSFENLICEPTTPPSLHSGAITTTYDGFRVYVPDASVSAYKTATNWSAYADHIYSINDMP